jgi:excisionase family DNA binding protein
MNAAVNSLYAEYLDHTGGDKAAAGCLTLAAVLVEHGSAAPQSETALTVAEAAKHLNLSSKKVYQMCQMGELQSFRAGRARRIPKIAIEQFESDNPGFSNEPNLVVFDHLA